MGRIELTADTAPPIAEIAANSVAFLLGGYEPVKALIIDPRLRPTNPMPDPPLPGRGFSGKLAEYIAPFVVGQGSSQSTIAISSDEIAPLLRAHAAVLPLLGLRALSVSTVIRAVLGQQVEGMALPLPDGFHLVVASRPRLQTRASDAARRTVVPYVEALLSRGQPLL
jgi:hypothetical protein